MEGSLEMSLQLAQRQLERMRAMQYQYHRKFFQWIIGTTAFFFALWIWGGPAAVLWIPFLIVTAGVQASFYLHFCDFSRMHARHLEHALNERLGRNVLIGSALENGYFYDLDRPKWSGLSPGAPFHFFSFFTLHWCVLWLAGMVASVAYTWDMISAGGWNVAYLAGLAVWVMVNGGYLDWYFLKRMDLQKMDELLTEELFSPMDQEK